MAISINPYVSPRIITVLSATSITIQNLVNWVMDWEDEPWALTFERIVKPSGKQNLGGTPPVLVGITAVLLNAKVRFEDQGSPTVCTIYGGNLVALDANNVSMSPIEPATNVTVVLSQSSSATIVADVAEWSQTEKDNIFADTTTIKTEVEKVQHDPGGGEYEPDKESLEAIRARIDEIYAKPTGAKGFSV